MTCSLGSPYSKSWELSNLCKLKHVQSQVQNILFAQRPRAEALAPVSCSLGSLVMSCSLGFKYRMFCLHRDPVLKLRPQCSLDSCSCGSPLLLSWELSDLCKPRTCTVWNMRTLLGSLSPSLTGIGWLLSKKC